ncbi:hypothetical protein ACFY0G_02040 [Streptomyces sp. NPDC001552]|uniref:hypothetical protein n=1 Tax=Streptomyces sp. NPDC001552 TaxID=3364587 RepID=UPI0036CD1E19
MHETVLDLSKSAFAQAAMHIAGSCAGCWPGARLPQLCPDGQALAMAALSVLFVVPPADPFGPGAAAYLQESERENAAAEVDRFADAMEANRLHHADVRRDAFYVRYAAKIVRDGLAAHILSAPQVPEGEQYLAEVDRLREEVFVAKADRDAAATWADALAFKAVPVEVLGRHEDGGYPWGDALDLITPAAEVDELRRQVEGLQAQLNEAVADGDRMARMLGLSGSAAAGGDVAEQPVAKACGRAQSTGEACPDHPVAVDPQARLAALEDERRRLLALLPTVPPIEQGTPNEIGAALAEFGAFELVAGVLGVQLPGSSM